jgi:hypothetical protein
MTHPDPGSGKAIFPEGQASRVEGKAITARHQEALDWLSIIRDQTFGNAERMEQLATDWGLSPAMTEPAEQISAAKTNLSAYWSGSAYNAFSGYASDTATKLGGNDGIMNDISGVLAQTVTTIYKTYSDAIKLISDTAIKLLDISKVDDITKELNSFVNNVVKLFADAMTTAGQYRATGITLAVKADSFKIPQAINDTAPATTYAGQWLVQHNPDPDPTN